MNPKSSLYINLRTKKLNTTNIDPQLKTIFKAAGITKKDLKNPEFSEYVFQEVSRITMN